MARPLSGSGCFAGHTKILTPSGSKRIDEVSVGDEVICFDDLGNLAVSKVLKVHEHLEATNLYYVWGGEILEATPNHWVLNQYNAFAQIDTLGPDDCLIDARGHLRPIIKKEDGASQCKVYNLTVHAYHTFIADGIRVHNAGSVFGHPIYGSGGGKGGGGSYTPKTAKDSLNSSAVVRIVELIGEGEIEGFPSARTYTQSDPNYYIAALKDIYFDKTPVLNKSANLSALSSGDYNFQNVSLNVRFGTNNQTYIAGFPTAENEVGVGVQVKKNTPITRTINDPDVDRVRVTITVEALQRITKKGDIKGTSLSYKIQASYGGGAFVDVLTDTVSGRTGDSYQRDKIFSISGGPFPVSVRVVRLTDDSSDPKLQNNFTWTSYTEITDAKLRYPNSAIVALRLNAKDFSSVPTRSYRIRGIKVKIPSNATVDSSNGRLIYSGTWDGTFRSATWCSDPCWCLWDLLTDCRYGLGHQIKSRDLDKWSFYKASVYCNELVSNGLGGFEPRFSCNVSIQNQDEAYKVINDLCSVFRAMPYWGAGTLMIAQDAPADPIFLFTQANVSEDGFQYATSSLRTRHTAAIVSYLNLDKQENDFVLIEDPAAMEKYGYFPVEVTAFATTSRSQAYRLGEWLVYTDQNECETVTFKCGLDGGVSVRPGSIISISDPLKSGTRRGGRIIAAGSNYIVVDAYGDTDLIVNGTGYVHVTLEDGTVIEKQISSISGPKIIVTSSFSVAPLVGGSFVMNDSVMESTTWRVMGVQEEENGEHSVTALSYNESKYEYVERGNSLVFKDYLPQDIPKPTSPSSIVSQVATYVDDQGVTQSKLALSWASQKNAVGYQVRYRLKTDESTE